MSVGHRATASSWARFVVWTVPASRPQRVHTSSPPPRAGRTWLWANLAAPRHTSPRNDPPGANFGALNVPFERDYQATRATLRALQPVSSRGVARLPAVAR